MKKITILGGGPAGYVAAIRAAQLGAQVRLVEAEQLGGTCLNVGCIPTKSLVHSARLMQTVNKLSQEGIILTEKPALDFKKVMQRKSAVVKRLVTGLAYLLNNKKVEIIRGVGKLEADRSVKVALDGGKSEMVQAEAVVISTGSEVSYPRAITPDGEWVITSTETLSLTEVPARLAIIGGGVIGVEFAYIYSQLGSSVTIIEQEQRLLPQEDSEISAALAQNLKSSGVTIHLASTVLRTEKAEQQVQVRNSRGEEFSVTADKVLVATGRRPRLRGLEGGAGTWLELRNGAVAVNSFLETSVPGIYAAGDITGGWQLAHAAFEQGAVAAENAVLGTRKTADLTFVPRCIYTSPEIAAVGMSEGEAKQRYDDVVIGRFPLNANGKALADSSAEGFVKIVARRKYGQVLGVAMMGENASDIIGQAVLALQLEATLEELAGVIAPHPTISESLKEAALGALGRALHI